MRPTCFGMAGLLMAVLLFASTAEAQLFGGNGLLNRKTDAPRAQTQDEIGVPSPVTGKVEVLKGREATFEIRAETKTPAASVEFLIRTFPSAGKIVSLTSNPGARNRAIVTYVADPNSSADKDAFAFAVRYRGGRYSSAMRFDIDLVDTQAEIQVLKEHDFGSAMIGDSVKQEIKVINLGDGAFERQLYLAPPWFLTEPKDGKLTLRPREGKTLTVSFRPQMVGETSYFLSLSRSSSGTTKLIGSGLDPFSVVTEEVELKLDPDSFVREGEVILNNASERPVIVRANGSTRLQQALESEYILAPAGETRVPLRLPETDTAPFDGMVQFSLKNGYMKTAQVVSAVVPGRLEVEVPGSISSGIINFEEVVAGRAMERGFKLTNLGGVAVPLEFHLPEPFRMLNDPGPQLAPQSSVNIAVGLFPAANQRGLVDVTMNVYGNEQVLPIRLLGNVLKPKGGPASAAPQPATQTTPLSGLRMRAGNEPDAAGAAESSGSTLSLSQMPDAAPEKQVGDAQSSLLGKMNSLEIQRLKSPLGFITQPLVERKLNPQLGSPEDLTVVERDASSVTIGWTAPKDSEFAEFEVELAGLHATPGNVPTNIWVPLKNVQFERIDRLVKAKIDNLGPARAYELRVITVGEDGYSSLPSEPLLAMTDLPMDWTYIYLGLAILLLALFVLAARKIYLNRRPEVYQAKYADQ